MFEKLQKWREDRNIFSGSYDWKTEIENDIEELFELMGFHKDDIEHLVNDFMDRYFTPELEPSDEVKIDAHCDKIVFSINSIAQLGYNPKECMDETIMEISSRIQDPAQYEEWNANGKSGKWKKFKDQDKNTLYKANYKKCKE